MSWTSLPREVGRGSRDADPVLRRGEWGWWHQGPMWKAFCTWPSPSFPSAWLRNVWVVLLLPTWRGADRVPGRDHHRIERRHMRVGGLRFGASLPNGYHSAGTCRGRARCLGGWVVGGSTGRAPTWTREGHVVTHPAPSRREHQSLRWAEVSILAADWRTPDPRRISPWHDHGRHTLEFTCPLPLVLWQQAQGLTRCTTSTPSR